MQFFVGWVDYGGGLWVWYVWLWGLVQWVVWNLVVQYFGFDCVVGCFGVVEIVGEVVVFFMLQVYYEELVVFGVMVDEVWLLFQGEVVIGLQVGYVVGVFEQFGWLGGFFVVYGCQCFVDVVVGKMCGIVVVVLGEFGQCVVWGFVVVYYLQWCVGLFEIEIVQ